MAKAKFRAKRTPGQMNATEQRYARHVLEPLRLAGEIAGWKYEAIKLKVGGSSPGKPAAWFTPDFVVYRADELVELVDVKGSGPAEEAALVRIRAAAMIHPEYLWVLAPEVKGRPGVFRREVVEA